ncbi:Lipid-A-disaccharide synthetase [Phytophthora infestans]|nr:Lipid-A-disaccharide synthetase [Phytophthora infestans]
MWRHRFVRRRLSVRPFSTGESLLAPLKLYVIAGEASGDAIGAKVIRALHRHPPPQSLEFRGIGGPLMCKAGDFDSLFPMQELSVMGLLEVVPHIWRFQRRIQDTLRDIETFNPDLILTIDSKGFTFRVLKALQVREQNGSGKRIKKVHYVAPSVWAYKHRGKRDFTELKQLLDAMFTILPFEEDIFNPTEENQSLENDGPSWCHFVGHPAVEDFLEANGVYGSEVAVSSECITVYDAETGVDALLNLSKYDQNDLLMRGRLFQDMAVKGRDTSVRTRVREKIGISEDAFVICALVGSRVNEVKNSSQLVLEAIEKFKQKSLEKQQEIIVVFPTLSAVEELVKARIAAHDAHVKCQVLTDLDTEDRLRLFQSSDAAVAVSGTVVLETTLANLPTVVIYRANRVTEWIAKRLAAVRFVSVPNLLLGKPLIPELLFSDCTAPKIAEELRGVQHKAHEERDALQLAIAISTLTKWTETAKNKVKPIRASDLVAKHILNVLEKK